MPRTQLHARSMSHSQPLMSSAMPAHAGCVGLNTAQQTSEQERGEDGRFPDGLPFDVRAHGYTTASMAPSWDTLTVTMVEAAPSSVNVVKVLCAP